MAQVCGKGGYSGTLRGWKGIKCISRCSFPLLWSLTDCWTSLPSAWVPFCVRVSRRTLSLALWHYAPALWPSEQQCCSLSVPLWTWATHSSCPLPRPRQPWDCSVAEWPPASRSELQTLPPVTFCASLQRALGDSDLEKRLEIRETKWQETMDRRTGRGTTQAMVCSP